MSTPFLRDKTLKFGTRVLYAPAEPLANGLFFSLARYCCFLYFLGYLGLEGYHISGGQI